MEGKKTKSQIDEKEFIKIDNSSLYLYKKTVFTFFAKANNFFDSFSIFANKITDEFQYTRKEFKNINAKLDFLIQGNLKNGKDKKEQTAYFLGGKNNKDKFPEDNRSHLNSKQSENVTSESLKNEEEEGPADSIKNGEEKTINNENSNKVSASINSQFFIYKKNLNDLNEE